ncbi:MAG: hypothetical protein ACK5LO_02485 [Leucobacter sp.]
MSPEWAARILDDGEDRESWLESRSSVICASDVKAYARSESVEKYVAAKIAARTFGGNEYTESGHEYEPMILAFLEVTPNKALIHAPSNPRFGATPDGLDTCLAECKVRHGKIAPNPSAGEWRQIAWQFMCVPESDVLKFGTLTVLRDETGAWMPRTIDPLSVLVIERDHPKITAAIGLIRPIADEVLAALDIALHAQKEVPF